jgi:molybdenum storage protein
MRESLIDKGLMASTEQQPPVVRMLPDAHVLKIGGRSIIDRGRTALFPLIEALAALLPTRRLVIGCGGGARSRHVFSIGLDLGLPTGVLAQLAIADALGNAHILGTLLAPYGVVAIPPEMFGHLLPLFLKAAPGVIFNGDPPYSIWEHPPGVGRIPPHRTDAGSYLLAECFGCKTFIPEVSVAELRRMRPRTLPFDEVLLDLLERARLVRRLQVVNGLKPERLAAALAGEHVGTIVHAG